MHQLCQYNNYIKPKKQQYKTHNTVPGSHFGHIMYTLGKTLGYDFEQNINTFIYPIHTAFINVRSYL